MILLNRINKNMAYNIGYIFHPYTRRQTYFKKKLNNINVGNIPLDFLFCEALFSVWKANIDCWVLLTTLTITVDGLYMHHLIT